MKCGKVEFTCCKVVDIQMFTGKENEFYKIFFEVIPNLNKKNIVIVQSVVDERIPDLEVGDTVLCVCKKQKPIKMIEYNEEFKNNGEDNKRKMSYYEYVLYKRSCKLGERRYLKEDCIALI